MDSENSYQSKGLDFLKGISLVDVLKHKISFLNTHTTQPSHLASKLTIFGVSLKTEEAAQILLQENILSAPVFDPNTKTFVGILDVLDLVCWSCHAYQMGREWRDVDFEQLVFASGVVGDIIGASIKLDKLFAFDSSQSLEGVILLLSDGREHRIIVSETKSKSILNVLTGTGSSVPVEMNKSFYLVSQSDIIRYLYSQKPNFSPLMSDLFNTKIGDLGMISPEGILSVPTKTRAFNAMKLLYEANVGAIAIVNRFGILKGNLSASDLRGISQEKLRFLGASVTQFLKVMNASRLHPSSLTPIVCSKDDTLLSVLDKVVNFSIHRVWIVDEEKKPIGVVSLTDILGTAMGTSKRTPSA